MNIDWLKRSVQQTQNVVQIRPTVASRQMTSQHYPPWESAFSMEALRRAWLPIRSNKGRGGSDGQTVAEFEQNLETNLQKLQVELLSGDYLPRNVTHILVPKPSGGWRPLTLWAIRDRVAQRAANDYLQPIFEQYYLPCSFGFRPGRSTKDAALAIQAIQKKGAKWVLDADIKDCFGQMRNDVLLRQLRQWRVPKPLGIYIRRWLHAKVWNAWRKDGEMAGTSQGGVISPLLCNLYLHAFDEAIYRTRGLWLVRYADDFVIMARERKTIEWGQKKATRELRKLGLRIHNEKTGITTFDDGFMFVGWFFVRNEMYQPSKKRKGK